MRPDFLKVILQHSIISEESSTAFAIKHREFNIKGVLFVLTIDLVSSWHTGSNQFSFSDLNGFLLCWAGSLGLILFAKIYYVKWSLFLPWSKLAGSFVTLLLYCLVLNSCFTLFFRFNSGFYRNNRFSLKADYFIKSHSFCRKPSQFYSRLLYKSEPFSLFLSQLSRWFLSNFEFVLSGMYSIQISLDCSR